LSQDAARYDAEQPSASDVDRIRAEANKALVDNRDEIQKAIKDGASAGRKLLPKLLALILLNDIGYFNTYWVLNDIRLLLQ
jgi:hypothetical protein